MELELPNAKGIKPAEPGSQLAAKPSPPLTVAALNLRLHMDPKTQSQEILAASVVHVSGVCGGGGVLVARFCLGARGVGQWAGQPSPIWVRFPRWLAAHGVLVFEREVTHIRCVEWLTAGPCLQLPDTTVFCTSMSCNICLPHTPGRCEP